MFLWGAVDDVLTRETVENLQYLYNKSHEPITMWIHSPGGDLDGQAAIIDEMSVIKEKGIVLTTVVLGMAYSAAACILVMATPGRRFARPNSTIMFHPCAYCLDFDYSSQQQKVTEFLNKQTEHYMKLAADAIGMGGKKYKKFKDDVDKGLWLTSQEALAYGVIDKILLGVTDGSNRRGTKKSIK